MNNSKVVIFSFVLLFALINLNVNADAKTIVVPDDFSSIQGAVANASDGDTIYVKSGNYSGPINQSMVIDKTVSIIGEDPKNTVLNLTPPWVFVGWSGVAEMYAYNSSIKIEADNVLVQGITINSVGVGQGAQIYTTGHGTKLVGNTITTGLYLGGSNENITQNNLTQTVLCSGSNSSVYGNTVTETELSIRGQGFAYTVYDNVLVDGSGISVYGTQNIVYNNTVTNCREGIAVASDASDNTVYANRLTNNTIGLKLSAEGNNNAFYANYVANNQHGVEARFYLPLGENNTFYHNNFVNNTQQVNIDPTITLGDGSVREAYHGGVFDNGTEGNYWSNYNGTDKNGDSVGDTPYVIDENRQDNYPLMEPFVLSGYNIHSEIPEFHSWLILPVLATVTALAIFYKRKLAKTPNWF
jgi:parallel beta-helix repeat protein